MLRRMTSALTSQFINMIKGKMLEEYTLILSLPYFLVALLLPFFPHLKSISSHQETAS